jgi:hypothetical protein
MKIENTKREAIQAQELSKTPSPYGLWAATSLLGFGLAYSQKKLSDFLFDVSPIPLSRSSSSLAAFSVNMALVVIPSLFYYFSPPAAVKAFLRLRKTDEEISTLLQLDLFEKTCLGNVAEAKKRLIDAWRSNASSLSLSDLNLSHYPPCLLKHFGSLTHLDLSHNQISCFQGLETLAGLKDLCITGNPTTVDPKTSAATLLKITKALHLENSKDFYASIPVLLSECPSLYNQIEDLPDSFPLALLASILLKALQDPSKRHLLKDVSLSSEEDLEHLHLLFEIKDWNESAFSKIQENRIAQNKALDLSNCNIHLFPKKLSSLLQHVEVLNVSDNSLTDLEWIKDYPRLISLEAENNKISDPSSHVLCPLLEKNKIDISLKGNPIEIPSSPLFPENMHSFIQTFPEFLLFFSKFHEACMFQKANVKQSIEALFKDLLSYALKDSCYQETFVNLAKNALKKPRKEIFFTLHELLLEKEISSIVDEELQAQIKHNCHLPLRHLEAFSKQQKEIASFFLYLGLISNFSLSNCAALQELKKIPGPFFVPPKLTEEAEIILKEKFNYGRQIHSEGIIQATDSFIVPESSSFQETIENDQDFF